MDDAPSDDALMARVRLGSKDAFRELMERWQRSLYSFFRLQGIEQSEAEDCVQETFIRVFTYRERYRPTSSGFRAFLFHLGRNVSADQFRKRRRFTRTEEDIDAVALYEDRAAGSRDVVAELDDRFDCAWAVGRLPERLRTVIVLNVFEGLSYGETAEVLGVPVGTVKSRMSHAFARLREILRVESRT